MNIVHMNLKRLVSFALFAVSLCLVPVLAQDPQLEKISTPPPEEVSEGIRQTLGSDGLRVAAEGEVLGDFWFREGLGLQETGNEGLGVEFGKLGQGTLVGVVHISANWSDYKDAAVSVGTYTLRYGVQPDDGDHMGVSLYRDFLLLIPCAEDPDPETSYDFDQLVEVSSKSSGKDHPAVLSLFPIYEEVTEPTILKNEMDQWTMAIPLGPVTLGLVLVGHGETEGL